MANLSPLTDIGVSIAELPEKLRIHLESLSEDEIRALAELQKKALDAGVGSVKPSLNGNPGNCIY